MPGSSNSSNALKEKTRPEDFLENGTSIPVAGNHPILLKSDNCFWVVTAGEADLFVVAIRENKPAGGRTHLFRACTGSMLFGIYMEKAENSMGVMAVGKPGTRLTRFPLEEFEKRFEESVAGTVMERAFNSWLAHVWSVIVQEGPPAGKCRNITAGPPVLFEEEGVLQSFRETVWVRALKGSFSLTHDVGKPDPRYLFPLTSNAWLHAAESTEIEGFTTAQALHEKTVWPSMEAFHHVALKCVTQRIYEDREAAEKRLLDQAFDDKSRLEEALFSLGSMLTSKDEPPVTESSERHPLCAAVELVAGASGIHFHMDEILETLHTEDIHLTDITRVGRFQARRVILTQGWWHKDNGPLLAFTRKDEHPVALLPLSARRYEMVDPAHGIRTKITSNMEDAFEPQAYALQRPLPSSALSLKQIISFALRGVGKDFFLLLGVGSLGAVLALLVPIMTGVIIDSVIPNAAENELFQIGAILTLCVLATLAFNITRCIAMVRIEGRMDASLQAGVMDRLLSLPTPFFRKFTAGDLANRTMGINGIRRVLSGSAITAMMTGIFSLFSLILLFWYDTPLAFISLSLTLVGVLVTALLSIWMLRYQRQVYDIQGKISGIVLQLLTGIAKLRATGTEERAFAVWADRFAAQKSLGFSAGKINAAIDAVSAFIPRLATTVIFFCFLKFRMGHMTTGQFLAFLSAFGIFQNGLVQMALVLAGALQVIPLFERAKPILETLPETLERKGKSAMLNGDIEVARVFFRYGPEAPLVLKDASLRVQAGEFVAIVGKSGSGKSTLLRLLLGFEKPESGAIYYDGKNLADLDIREFRHKLGVVLQHGQLTAESIFENIAGSTRCSLEDAWDAARMVGLEDDIKAMPMGMHTMVPPGGGTFSGGQRQRLMIAAAIVKRPRIIFFDEATSALDNLTQATVSESLESLKIARVVIAQRLSTIVHADRIYVIQKGEVVETGSYAELMAERKVFYELARRQIDEDP